MRALLLLLALFAGTFAALPSAAALDAAAACAPPCGPIPVIITITLDKSRNVEFDEDGMFRAQGKVQYYFDIDQNGYGYDPAKEMKVTLKVNKQPAWTKTTLEPTEFVVPLRPQDGCPDCVKSEGQAPESQFIYEHPLKVTIEKTRDFDAAELKKWLKSDGTYRVSISAVSNESMAGTDATGKPAGLMEGYGVKEVRFTAPADLRAQLAAPQSDGATAPGASMFGFLAALGATLMLLRRDE